MLKLYIPQFLLSAGRRGGSAVSSCGEPQELQASIKGKEARTIPYSGTSAPVYPATQ